MSARALTGSQARIAAATPLIGLVDELGPSPLVGSAPAFETVGMTGMGAVFDSSGSALQPGGVVSVYVVDHQDRVRVGLVELLGAVENFTVVGSSGSVVEAVEEIIGLRPRVAVVDGRLGDGDGLDLVRALARHAPEVASVILTAGVGDSWGLPEAAEAGAAAFVLKALVDFPLVEVISRVAAGERFLRAPLPGPSLWSVDVAARTGTIFTDKA